MDAIDLEFKQLVETMSAEEHAEAVLRAFQSLLDAEKLPPGLERRMIVAQSLGMMICSLPAAWESVQAANPELTNFAQVTGAVRVALGMLFDLT
jgi:hypothetical protein